MTKRCSTDLLLLQVLERSLEKEPIMLFVHMQTGSSLSAKAVHPEMWGVLKHLCDFAAERRAAHAPGRYPRLCTAVRARVEWPATSVRANRKHCVCVGGGGSWC